MEPPTLGTKCPPSTVISSDPLSLSSTVPSTIISSAPLSLPSTVPTPGSGKAVGRRTRQRRRASQKRRLDAKSESVAAPAPMLLSALSSTPSAAISSPAIMRAPAPTIGDLSAAATEAASAAVAAAEAVKAAADAAARAAEAFSALNTALTTSAPVEGGP
ncbi:unnamed protein product [Penicillium glandicola]